MTRLLPELSTYEDNYPGSFTREDGFYHVERSNGEEQIMFFFRHNRCEIRGIPGCWYDDYSIIHDHDLRKIGERSYEKQRIPRKLEQSKIWQQSIKINISGS